jgi:hypothetical protein
VIAAAWVWVLVGLALVLAAGLVVVIALGLAGMPGDFLRRHGQSAAAGRTDAGGALPDEVPDAGAEETARRVEDDQAG